jgi:hypothetical protein
MSSPPLPESGLFLGDARCPSSAGAEIVSGISVALFLVVPRKSNHGGNQTMTPEQHKSTDEVLRRVQGEFLEMPGLRLTGAQARRLWGLDAPLCDALLGALVDAKFLFRTRDGAFMKTDHAAPVKASIRTRYAGAA